MTILSESSPREQLLRLQKATFARLEEEIRRRESSESRVLKLYRRRYEREVKTFRRVSNKAELLEKVLGSSIVYCGDYHTLRHAQRTVIRILRDVAGRKKNIRLGLELVSRQGEKLANDFVRRRVDEKSFLEGIDYERRWGFPWKHYRPLFEFAQRHQIRILALNSDFGDKLPLEARDDFAADLIAQATIENPDSLIFCLYGDLHLADVHIPNRVTSRLRTLKAQRKTLTLFQNSEAIYWQLAERGIVETTDVVEISPHKYCVLSAAPWVKWQSYQSWLEDQSNLLSPPSDPEESDGSSPDYYHQVLDLAQRIAEFLGLKKEKLEHFSVVTAEDTKIVPALEKYCAACHRRDIRIEAIVRAEMIENRSIFLPEDSILYLSDLSENRAAEKAAQLLAASLQPRASVFGEARTAPELFYRLVLWEAVGFIGSKIINPKRKTEHYRDFELILLRTRGSRLRGKARDFREVAIQVLAHRKHELRRIRKGGVRGSPRKLYHLPPHRLFLAASAIGKILGNHLYLELMKDRLTVARIRELFSPLPEGPKAASNRYWVFVESVSRHAMTEDSKEDRL